MGTFKKFAIVAFLLLTAFQASAQSAAETLLARDLITPSKVLKNEIKIYNYFTLGQAYPQLDTAAGRHDYVVNYLSSRGGTFWDPEFNDASTKNYAAGPGLYFAIDPLISKQYGNSFIEMTVPAGTRFINVVAPIPIKKDTMAALVAEGIIQQSQVIELFPKANGFYRDTLRVMVQAPYTEFRKMVQRVFTKNNIQFIEYNFNSSLSGFCNKHSYSAFNFLGIDNPSDLKNATLSEGFKAINMFSTELHFNNLTSEENTQQNNIVKFRTVLENIPSARRNGATSINSYILSQYSASEYQHIKDETYSCDK